MPWRVDMWWSPSSHFQKASEAQLLGMSHLPVSQDFTASDDTWVGNNPTLFLNFPANYWLKVITNLSLLCSVL